MGSTLAGALRAASQLSLLDAALPGALAPLA
jgi:hypothetical protein